MKPAQRLILFLHSFSGGVLMPILSLLLLERGCDLRTLPLVLGVYSATVILCEVPTGVCADLLGRKKTFLISCALGVGSMLALLLSGSVWGLLACGVASAAVGTLGFAGLCLTAGAAVLLCTASALFLRKPRKSVTN